MKPLILLLAISGPALAEPMPLDPAGFATHDPAAVELGQLLFYDPILSGNRTVSCATCHHPRFATGDGLALGLGDGGIGLGPDRKADPDNLPEQRIPRNAPALFNIGHRDVTVMFHDGRIEVDDSQPNGLRTPLDSDMLAGFDSLLSAQTMFPVLSPDEMAGHYQENDVSLAVRQGRLTGDGGAWDIISQRVAAIPEYRARFADAYPMRDSIAFTDISNAIAAFVDTEWRATDTAYDRHLRGDESLSGAAKDGMELFFGVAGCGDCHSGPLLSDQQFHAMGTPQIGPGKAARFESHQRDDGRMRVTGRSEDAYAFRTPMLRNVTRTGPWGHAGAHDDLRAFLRDHAEPGSELVSVTLPDLPRAAPDFAVWDEPAEREAILAAVTVTPMPLSDSDFDALMAFLGSLEDTSAIAGKLGVPNSVPSGLPVDR
ncbi:Cytochrome c551 peroxidase precursor [Rhodobacteraceae bacterium THAF1]|uniref:cytochrome-c peroxidase n=1 Tax=Palleronia sp. THAF1 TaxID=2587842 RepID=UPI000F3F1C0F|nr:cytochrome-c peroxidase [Palleronia sp. THAF1]QFU07702.1 Cytochrome c551 peroxidase precursor [Palleronia sp. THAF1]VDC23158.1 Cytochrome c551 peroxidase precursor [Rhodobacteraceae bacterium THAF1]